MTVFEMRKSVSRSLFNNRLCPADGCFFESGDEISAPKPSMDVSMFNLFRRCVSDLADGHIKV